MNFTDLAKERYSCRSFSDKKVEKELIDKIIETGISSPTAVNAQPYKLFLMESKESKDIIRKVTKCSFGADNFIVVGYKNELGWVRPFDNRCFADVDASIVATHIMLEIHNLGLASTWVGYFDAPLLKELCPQMADFELIAIFPIGYPSDYAEPSERHFKRKSKEEVLEIL